jgi:hypothetical protein
MIEIVTCDEGAGDGAGAGAGDGDGDGDGDGAGDGDGVADGELGDEYPPPHAETVRAMMAAATEKREKRVKRIAGTSWDPDEAAPASTGLRQGRASRAPYCRRVKWAASRRARHRCVTARESLYGCRIARCARNLYH